MITGFNSDIEHGGVVYHVQTEDKGLETPLILSLVYVGGAILASKRSSYKDLIEAGFDVKTLTERLQRQHKLICAAIRAGRIEDLKRMGGEKEAGAPAPPVAAPAPPPAKKKTSAPLKQVVEEPTPVVVEQEAPPLEIITSFDVPIIPDEVYRPLPPSPPEPPRIETSQLDAAFLPDYLEDAEISQVEDTSEDLYLTLIDDEGEFRAGQLVTIKIYVGRGLYGRWSVADADVTVKILGTTFRPIILSARTDENGFAVVRTPLPRFSSGRAAIVIRAVDGEDDTEMRRMIHQS